ncbi:MAG: serine/threonine-protein phosphatase [Planctomycetes bacterium]|nr:serine/threonine-protein phosphatase [Planctomycetota bacterium]
MLRDLFSRNREPEGPSPEELEAKRREEVANKVKLAIATDPSFQILTPDGLQWICPFSGTRIEATFGYQDAAINHLVNTQPWTKGKIKPLADLQRLRWAVWLRDHLREDQRLHHLANGRWLNPLTAAWVPLPGAVGGKITAQVVEQMAALLAQSPESKRGVEAIKPREVLEKAAEEAGSDPSGQHVVISEVHGHTRVSGAQESSRTPVRMATDLDLAGGILGKILSPMPSVPGWRFGALFEPQDQIGGDFYEIQRLDDHRWFVAIADVTGHGVQGAMVVVSALKALRYAIKSERTLVDILAKLNEDVKPDLLDGQFITCFAGILDISTSKLECVCAGHHRAVLMREAGTVMVERVGERGPALGLIRGDMFKKALKPRTIELAPGDLFVQFTDGLSEAMDGNQKEFGERRLIGRLLHEAEGPFEEMLQHTSAAVRRFAMGILGDDATILAFGPDLPPEEDSSH